ncbi:TIP41-like family-domain-containing protein, partial [Mycotypha africana]|uniref:TIP41-like family-domain-containing protein n=1 Tax=Mycotypha africana TaxID=64632 RepID=UPI002301FD3B
GIQLNDWIISSKKAPICNSNEMERIQKNFGLPPPEMVFGNSRVTIQFKNDFELNLNAYDALARIDTSSSSSEKIKVAYAAEWKRKSVTNYTDIKDVVKPYDWTYTTTYRGTTNQTFETYEGDSLINMDLLKKQEPILFYDENILYEDELADNGTAVLSVRLRVMQSCFLILQRFFLRVDDVLFRINDTRIFHEFGKDHVVREYLSKEAHFNDIRQVKNSGRMIK